MSKSKSGKGGNGGLSADDLAIIAGVVVVIGDILALWAVIQAKREDDAADAEAQANTSAYRGARKKRKSS
ncbi:hypothetical protein [Paenibacillus soyae]|uniref:Uncharacterized protein n=1 Tax=Paenibacillus soyae TaxID=2969249 RepID=A0A9X2S7R9_9BACL|nr:hypothetical protein [Paenibacillus soyae]MCR2803629.1 hypothetical protein [Paenibacillus soyae]